jgi:hypothetical protein
MTHPNLFLVGAPKCATTSLYDLFSRHPQILCPEVKEPGYFTRTAIRPNAGPAMPHQQSLEGYLDLYANPPVGTRVCCDGSTSYLRHPEALQQISDLGADVRAVAVYRDPVELVSSYFTFLQTETWEDQPTLEAAWRIQEDRRRGHKIPAAARRPSSVIYSNVALLGRQITDARHIFGDRLKVYDMKELTKETARVSHEIQTWIGVDAQDLGALPSLNPARSARYRMLNLLAKNPPLPLRVVKNKLKSVLGMSSLGIVKTIARMNEVPVKREMDEALRHEMQIYFKEDVCLLEETVGKNLRGAWGWT